jgi:hypothetical protein
MNQKFNQKFNEDVATALHDAIHTHLGAFVLESIEDLVKWSVEPDAEQLSVIDGAIAFGAWLATPDELEQLRAIRDAFAEGIE